MGVLIGGILIFLILSLILLFGGKREELPPLPQSVDPNQRVNTTPYPTIPPIENMTVLINERRLNPSDVTIKAGNMVSFFNIGTSAVTIQGADANSGFLNFTVPANETYEYTFRNAGTYTYRVAGTALVGTIVIE